MSLSESFLCFIPNTIISSFIIFPHSAYWLLDLYSSFFLPRALISPHLTNLKLNSFSSLLISLFLTLVHSSHLHSHFLKSISLPLHFLVSYTRQSLHYKIQSLINASFHFFTFTISSNFTFFSVCFIKPSVIQYFHPMCLYWLLFPLLNLFALPLLVLSSLNVPPSAHLPLRPPFSPSAWSGRRGTIFPQHKSSSAVSPRATASRPGNKRP